ncbi:fumarylacetoacetate hydrolase family protein [Pelagibacterium luteolum]|uniref:Fumarylacetoacetate (FAA) hydrolase family protein n=1 Tax=Pelagibacterium luteolum TaxID=440168 RepID=A0A1G7XJB4_9HYPH|nr:fumarylacetoacetate hydrolase family protein [Pelagibacterium luteolum]SDG84268.1 Fumarylacetoacetate (FAA) hydrolase family protein [Pelagibacterium luteolum]
MIASTTVPASNFVIPLPEEGVFLGRVKLADGGYPRVVTVREGKVLDITAKAAPTVRDICEMDDPAGYVASVEGKAVADLDAFLAGTAEGVELLSPVDLQAVKASGVTFVVSLLERVIEEQAKGDAGRADQLRGEILELIGEDLSQLVPGSEQAMAVKAKLVEKGVWSQYLEVGIGPDAEIFTKCQPMASVGHGAEVGLHPISTWNNPEPEVAVVVSSKGRIVGVTLGNDVNLRDVEGRSALLLGKAKDNNASAALGPFIRLFDDGFSLQDVKEMEIGLEVRGEDGFVLDGSSSMSQISRTPESLVAAAIGDHHQYPDGLVLYLGTMFAPVQDRDGAGKGFTHKLGDVVTISTPTLGALVATVRHSTGCRAWTYGTRALMTDLAKAGLI